MLIRAWAREFGACSPEKIDKNGPIWCIPSVQEHQLSTYKSTIFGIINQKPKFCAILSSKINPDAHFITNINTFTFYKVVGERAYKCKKNWRIFLFDIKYYRHLDSHVMMWIQIHSRGSGSMPPPPWFLLNGAIWRILNVPKTLLST